MTKKKDPGVLKVEMNPKKEYGIQEIHLQPGVHTLILDAARMKQSAIADFVKEFSKNATYPYNEDIIAMAVGVFDIPLDLIYEEDTSIKNLNDRMLGKIVKYRMARANAEAEKGQD